MSSLDVRSHKNGGVQNAAIHMGFCGEVNDSIDSLADTSLNIRDGSDIPTHESVARMRGQLGKVCQVSGIA